MASSNGTATTAPLSITSRDNLPMKWFFGCKTWLHASIGSTGGTIGAIEQIGAPGLGSPYHTHHNEDEIFYVIEGSVRFVSGNNSWVAGPGSWAFLPRDVPHGFEVVGDTDARFLLMVTPAGFEAFVTELWEDAPGPPDMERVMECTGRYALEIHGPLPS